MSRDTPRNKDDKAEEHYQGISDRSRRCGSLRVRKGSLLRVQGGRWVTIISHGVEIAIAGGVRNMVHGPNPRSFLFYFIMRSFFLGTRSFVQR